MRFKVKIQLPSFTCWYLVFLVLFKRQSFPHCEDLTLTSCQKSFDQIYGLIMGYYVWSLCLSSCQYHNVLITVVLYYVLKSGHVRPSVFIIFLQITLAIWGLLRFHTNLRFFFYLKELRFWKGFHWLFRSLWGVWTLIILSFPIHNHGLYFHLCFYFLWKCVLHCTTLFPSLVYSLSISFMLMLL